MSLESQRGDHAAGLKREDAKDDEIFAAGKLGRVFQHRVVPKKKHKGKQEQSKRHDERLASSHPRRVDVAASGEKAVVKSHARRRATSHQGRIIRTRQIN